MIAWPEGLGTGFLTDLGFTIPKSFAKFVDDQVAQAQIPAKDTGVLNDAEVLVWATDVAGDGADIQQDKVLGKLDAVKEGRSVYTGDDAGLGDLLQHDPESPVRARSSSFPSWRRSCPG